MQRSAKCRNGVECGFSEAFIDYTPLNYNFDEDSRMKNDRPGYRRSSRYRWSFSDPDPRMTNRVTNLWVCEHCHRENTRPTIYETPIDLPL